MNPKKWLQPHKHTPNNEQYVYIMYREKGAVSRYITIAYYHNAQYVDHQHNVYTNVIGWAVIPVPEIAPVPLYPPLCWITNTNKQIKESIGVHTFFEMYMDSGRSCSVGSIVCKNEKDRLRIIEAFDNGDFLDQEWKDRLDITITDFNIKSRQ